LMPLTAEGLELQRTSSGRSVIPIESPPKQPNLNLANVIVSCDVLNALASGMSLKFLNLFLIEDYGVSPIGLLWVAVWQNLATVFLTPTIKTMMKKMRKTGVKGAVVVSGVWFVALIFMALICVPGLHLYVVVFAIIANASLTSCTKAHNRAKLVDSLPHSRVAGYMVWDSLNKANQGGITIFGGQLCNAYGYRGCFVVTLFILLIRWIIYTAYMLRHGFVKGKVKRLESQVEASIRREEEIFDDHDPQNNGELLSPAFAANVADDYHLTDYMKAAGFGNLRSSSPEQVAVVVEPSPTGRSDERSGSWWPAMFSKQRSGKTGLLDS